MKALTFLLFLAAAGLGAWAVREYLERTRLEAELSGVKSERDKFAKTARTKTSLIAGMEVKEDGPRGLKDLGIPLDDEEKPEEEPAGKKPGEKDTAAAASDMLKSMRDPAMLDRLRVQALAQLEMQYGGFFDVMGLDEAKRDALMDILKSRAATRLDLGFKTMDRGLAVDDRHAASAELAKANDEANRKLRELFGQDYPKFERFEASAPEREQIKRLNAMLKEKGLVMDEVTESKLTEAIYDVRQAFKFDRDLTDLSRLAPQDLSEQAVGRYLEQNAVLQQQVQAKAKEILSAAQFEEFVKAQEIQSQLTQTEIQMWQQMTGNSKSTEGKD